MTLIRTDGRADGRAVSGGMLDIMYQSSRSSQRICISDIVSLGAAKHR